MECILSIQNVTKKYGEKVIIENENFSVYKGDILGFIGPNGAGKSTSINIISTLVSPDNGSILFHGQDISSNRLNYKKSLGIVPQDLAIYEDLNAYDNVAFFCSLYGIRGMELKEKVKKALEFVGLWDRRKDLPSKFSGGMKRRLNIACAITHEPELLIMDEPTVGIDPQSRNKILEAVKELNRTGTTVIYTSHYMEEIEALCNRIVLLDKGNVIEDLSKNDYKAKYEQMGCSTLEDIFLYTTGTDLRDMEG
ncbi:TPA: ABC transporter ATP-binding protein [Clostridioides difficile]|uniref:ABC transporter ATP-binding protein n=1 Tax=Clostridia TaxID=186801 RepID=UPI00038CBF22|nr:MULTISPECIES: ABC transporter ATP-binding protein [Clostridia]MDU4302428.1 ABC transporter ATP-binding protein [Enterococcus faecalis]MDU4867121.1 ABC transporter ATP-binding protein [Bacteroides sp.]MDU5222825.1 ABC transporter ATP-binding protein [Blautia producta]HDN2469797.1 ABC transporter ATP-binding protein [Clostridioides difficile CD196]EGT4171504.1 ABC transporter ATP-binding protein [Clostridioides difficile]